MRVLSNVAKACSCYHIRALCHVHGLLADDVALTFVTCCSIVTSRLDYCNALLCGAQEATFDKLQPKQSSQSRLTPNHWSGHFWQRVTYKVALTTYSPRITATQLHVPERLDREPRSLPHRVLRSFGAPLLTDPRRLGSPKFQTGLPCILRCGSLCLELSTR